MATHYVSRETAKFTTLRKGKKTVIELLWGDGVRVDAALPSSGPVQGIARGVKGEIDVKDLGGEPLLELYFIDVGQGDGILIRTPDGRHVLIDGGFSRSKQPTGKNAADFVDWKFKRDYGMNEIVLDAMIASHNDADHYGGLWDLLNPDQKQELDVDKVVVKAFYHAGVGWWKDSQGKRSLGAREAGFLTTLLEDRGNVEAAFAGGDYTPQGEWASFLETVLKASPKISKIRRLSHVTGYVPGFEPAEGQAAIRILGPVEFDLGNGKPGLQALGSDSLNTNGNSVLLRVDFGQTRMLLTGDLNAAAQKVLLDNYQGERLEFAADVAKACHHGSDDCSLDFLSAIGAGATVISSGDNETHAHPRPAIVAASAVTGHRIVEKDRLITPIVYSTEIARSVRIGRITAVRAGGAEVLNGASNAEFDYAEVRAGALRPEKGTKKWPGVQAVVGVVYGLVNVRTDGNRILCATLNEGESKWEVRTFTSRF